MPTKLPSTIPAKTQQAILNALITASFTLHAGKAVLDLARALFETVSVEEAISERRVDEKEMGMNGGWGEGQACKSLARAVVLLEQQGEEANAEQVKKVALGHFTGDMWEENVKAVRAGW